MKSSVSVTALSEWDRPGNDQPLAKLTLGQVNVLSGIETHMEGRRSFKEVRNLFGVYYHNLRR
jgi:hypothetical protein